MKNRPSSQLAFILSLSVLALAACNGGESDPVHVSTSTATTSTNVNSGPSTSNIVVVSQPVIDNTTTILAPVTVYTPPTTVYVPAPPTVVYVPTAPIIENPNVYVPAPTTTYSSGYDSGYDSSYNSGDDSYEGYDDSYSSADDGDSYYSSGSDGGCDSSGCNSFGSGGSKNTGLLAAKVTKAQMTAKANSVASQFQMSFDSAYKLTQLASQVQGMKQQRQMTQADRDAVVQSAFKIAGVTQTEVSTAVVSSLQSGNQKAIEDVMSKAAQNLGMPSGQTFRDKLLPLFDR